VHSKVHLDTDASLKPLDLSDTGLPYFLGTTYQNGEKYTKLPQNIPNGCKIDQMSIKYTQHLPLQGPPKFTQIGILGWKFYHPATLM
jgi:hypothetical protein